MKKFIIILLAFVSCNKDHKNPPNAPLKKKDATEVTIRVTDTVTVLEEADKTASGPIADIRQKVEQINTASLHKKHFEFMCDEKMIVDYFYENGQIVKIAIDFGTVGDTYAKEGYYYDAGELIFIYEYVESGPACDDCIITNEYRSYISGNKTIKYLKDKATQPCKKCEFNAASKQYKLLQANTTEEIKAILCR